MTRRMPSLILVGILFLVGCQGASSPVAGGPIESTRLPLAVVATPDRLTPIPQAIDEIPRISSSDLWHRLQAGEAILVVDARSFEAYEREHILGAVSMPQADVGERVSEIPEDDLIVFY